MAFACYESEGQVKDILRRIDEAVEQEFVEEEATNFQHRDKSKEMNVMEWVAKVIAEPLQGSVQIDLFLRDGVKICQLINRIKEDSIKSHNIMAGTTEARKNNIQLFLHAVLAYGVPSKYLFEVDDLLCLKRISRVTRCLYVLAVLASKDFAYHGAKLATVDTPRERKISMPECDRANMANVNISNIFWNLMEDAERRSSSHHSKRRPSLVEFKE